MSSPEEHSLSPAQSPLITAPGLSSGLDLKTALAIATTLLFWASAFAAIRSGMRPGAYAPGHLALLRFMTASVVFGICAAMMRMRLPQRGDLAAMALMGFLGVTVYHTALNYGELSVTAGTASFLINTAPIFTALLATIFLHERLKFWGWAGIVISFGGAAIIALGEGHGLHVVRGALLILLSAVCASFYTILQKNLLKRYTALEVTACSVWFGTIGLLWFAPGLGQAVLTVPDSATWAALYLGIFPTALAYLTWAYALSRLTASHTISFIYLMPALAVLIAWVWLGEVPPPASFLGGLVALAGVVLVNLYGK